MSIDLGNFYGNVAQPTPLTPKSISLTDVYGFGPPKPATNPFINLGITVTPIPTPTIVIPSVFVQVAQPVNIVLTGSTPARFASAPPSSIIEQAQSTEKAKASAVGDTVDKTETAKSTDRTYTAEQLFKRWNKMAPNVITPAFCERVVKMAKNIQCNPDDLMAIMKSESDFKPNHQNKKGTASGLFQFLRDTFKDLRQYCPSLGWIDENLYAAMSPLKQLDVAEKFFLRAKKIAKLEGQPLDAGTLYALNFLPARANYQKTKLNYLARKGERYYNWNPGFDKNGDGIITKDELAKHLDTLRPKK